MLISEEAMQAFKAKDARARKFTVRIKHEAPFDVVMRPPSWAEFTSWRQLIRSSEPAKAAGANKQLVLFCTLYPDPKTPEFDQVFNQFAGLCDNLANHLGDMAGLTAEVEVGE